MSFLPDLFDCIDLCWCWNERLFIVFYFLYSSFSSHIDLFINVRFRFLLMLLLFIFLYWCHFYLICLIVLICVDVEMNGYFFWFLFFYTYFSGWLLRLLLSSEEDSFWFHSIMFFLLCAIFRYSHADLILYIESLARVVYSWGFVQICKHRSYNKL